MCVGVQCGKNLLFYDKIYTRGLFLPKGDRNLMFFTLISAPLPFHTGIPKKNGIWIPKTTGKKEVRNLWSPVPAAHPARHSVHLALAESESK